jgi:hypothetical protein
MSDEPTVVDLEPTLANLTEMTLKRPDDLRSVSRDEELQPRVVLNLLLIGLSGIALFSIAFTIILACAPPLDWVPRVSLSDRSLFRPLLTYTIGMVGALGLCLPSFYFYGLLAGVRASMLQVTAISLHALANTGMILMGLLPIYVGAILGVIVIGATDGPLYPFLVGVGLLLPFVSGLATLRVMYRGFVDLLRTLPEARAEGRAPMVRLLAVAWAALYTAVAPVTLWAVRTQMEKLL